MPRWNKLQSPPNTHWHDTVMRDVIKVDKVKAFAKKENKRLEEVGEFTDKIQPAAS